MRRYIKFYYVKACRTVVGSLQYLCLTCLDSICVVNKLSQFMHQPTTYHWNDAKHLLRYLSSTTNHGFALYRHTSLYLSAFSNGNWAGNKDDYTSTSNYIVYFGKNPSSWSFKKQCAVIRSSAKA